LDAESNPRLKWLWRSIVIIGIGALCFAAWIFPRLRGSGPIVQVLDFDDHRTELTKIFMGARATRIVPRKAAISKQIEDEIRKSGLGDLLPILRRVPTNGWCISEDFEVGHGRTFSVQGLVACDPNKAMDAARKILNRPRYVLNSAGFQLSGEAPKNGKAVSFYLFTRPEFPKNSFSLYFHIRRFH